MIHADEGFAHYEYDGHGHICAVTDENGVRYLVNSYDEKGRTLHQDIGGRIYQDFSYDDGKRCNTFYFSENGRTEIYEYNDQLLTERISYSDGTCISYEYNDQNLRTAEVSMGGTRTEWEYDEYGRMVREVKPDGLATHYEYDGNHDLVRVWDTDGRETIYEYDKGHNLISTKEKIAEGRWRETARRYDEKGRKISERDGMGNETVCQYGEKNAHPASVTTPPGEETVYEYDRAGRRVSIGNAYGTVQMLYNSRNFVTSRTDGEGYVSRWSYDRMGNLTSYYPARNWKNQEGGYEYRYGFLERLEDIVSPMQEHQKVFRNFAGDVTRSIHPVAYQEKGEEGEGTRYEYDIHDRCIRIHYPDGGIERRFYDAGGNMIKQVLPEAYDQVLDDGAGYRYAYDVAGRLVCIEDPEGNVLRRYEYNGHGQVTRETDGEGKVTLNRYDDLGQLTEQRTSIRKEDSHIYFRVIRYLYDLQGNKTEELYGQEEVEGDAEPVNWHRIRFSYDGNNHLTSVQDDFGAQVRYAYDCLGNRTLEEQTVEEGICRRVHYRYNRNGWLIRREEEIQGNGENSVAITLYSHDENGNVTKVKTPNGFEIRRIYDADDRLVEQRVIDRKNGIDHRTFYAYDAAGNVLSETVQGTDGERLESSCRYDLKNRLTCRTDPAGAVIRYLYDPNDRLVKEIRSNSQEEGTGGSETTYSYDSRGNRIRKVNALGQLVWEQGYNLQDLPTVQTDGLGSQTSMDYTPDSQRKGVRRGRGTEQRQLQGYSYNAQGQIIGITDGNGEKIAYDADSWGRITGIGFSDGVREGYEYTPSGQVRKTIDGNGNAVEYRYNSMGKVRERIDQAGYSETFQYDAEGNLTLHVDRDGRRVYRAYNVFGDMVYGKATDANGENPNITTCHYDSIGRLTKAVCDGHSYEYIYNEQGLLQEKRSSGKRLVSYAYDATGQLASIKDPAGTTTHYEYDLLGRTSRIYSDQGMEVRYAYDCLDRVEKISYANRVETTYQYDAYGNLSSLSTKMGRTSLLSFTYAYDGNGNRISKVGQQRVAAGAEYSLNVSYAYDIRGRLLEEKRNGDSCRYAYDAAGNRIKKESPEGNTAYQYNKKNQLISFADWRDKKEFTYDKQGSIVKEESSNNVVRFQYNSKNQQVRVERGDGQVQENRYDAEGLRHEIRENGKLFQFVYHQGEVLYEGGDNDQTSYHLGKGIQAFQRTGENYYYHQDEQLSTALITYQAGEIQNHYLYDAFGNEMEKAEQLSNRIRYTGQQYDSATGQYYLRARYYNPVLGRFLQEDVYQGDGLNLYAYCDSNPVMYSDPSGYTKRRYAQQGHNDGLGDSSVRPEAALTGGKKHGINWQEGPARARNTGKPQGQWTLSDLDYATGIANTLKPGESGYFDLPEGSQSVIYMPDGTTQPATRMWIRNNGTGTWHGYPIP